MNLIDKLLSDFISKKIIINVHTEEDARLFLTMLDEFSDNKIEFKYDIAPNKKVSINPCCIHDEMTCYLYENDKKAINGENIEHCITVLHYEDDDVMLLGKEIAFFSSETVEDMIKKDEEYLEEKENEEEELYMDGIEYEDSNEVYVPKQSVPLPEDFLRKIIREEIYAVFKEMANKN